MKAKKLIEVAMPIKEISAESVRDKSIRHGHISTLHLWWARRPLPTCRAVVFASLVPDPLDENCPQAFKDAVFELLQKDGMDKLTYAPYPDIPYTAIHDPMEENLRNRLLMFIGKFSPKCQENMLAGKATSPKDQLSDGCLIKWESKNDERVLGKARKLIWVAYNSEKYPEKTYTQLSDAFDAAYKSIHDAESALYSTQNRHKKTSEVVVLEENLKNAIESFQNNMPSVFDPFAGGGAIPLEAARLGCRSYGNDINPVAHIVEKGSVEFPQKYGKPISFTRDEFENIYGEDGWILLQEKGIHPFNPNIIEIPNRLSFDVEYYARRVLLLTEKEVGHMYPCDEHGNKPIAYYWARTAICSNPTCRARIPLLKSFQVADTTANKYYLKPSIDGTNISFEYRRGKCDSNGWNNRGNLTCPCCGATTSVDELKRQSNDNKLSPMLIGGIFNSANGKQYKAINQADKALIESPIPGMEYPTEKMSRNSNGGDTHPWGFVRWSDLYSDRQLTVLYTFQKHIQEIDCIGDETYSRILKTYLGIWFDRIALVSTSFGRWNVKRETIEHPYNRQAVAMVFDYPETNPFSGVTGSAVNQLEWVVRYIESESSQFSAILTNASSGEKSQFDPKSITAVVTDPPYYDAIAYADISDLFYLWQKRTIGKLYPINFGTPQTPKSEECTAIKYHHDGDYDKAKRHFENKLLRIFEAIELQTSDIISIMFAHQSTEAWTTLCNSILGANMNIMGSWALDTEMATRAVGLSGDALESSVTVACKPSERKGFVGYKKIKDAIREKVSEEVRTLYNLGFRGADLLTACFGKAVSEFGNYETVEKNDGSEVTVAELLELARTSAFTALLRDFSGDDYTKFYIGWLQLNGMGDTDFDDATKFTRVGMSVNIGDIQHASILIRDDASRKQHLASYNERVGLGLRGMSEDKPLIDKVHLAMKLWEAGDRNYLLPFIAQYGNDINNEFWRVLVVLKELLPITTDDYAQASGLLQNAESLIRDSKDIHVTTDDGPTLFDGLE